MIILLIVYIAYIVIMSIVSFALYAKDKKMAVKNGGPERIKEKYLLETAVLGGGLGAFLGRIICHHKTDKVYFSLIIYLSLLSQAAVLVFMALMALGIIAL